MKLAIPPVIIAVCAGGIMLALSPSDNNIKQKSTGNTPMVISNTYYNFNNISSRVAASPREYLKITNASRKTLTGTLTCIGSVILVDINGNRVMEISDAILTRSPISFNLEGNNAHYTIDDLQITKIN